MNQKFFALLAASALAFSFACSDDETTTSTSNGGNGGNGTGGDATGGNGTGGSTAECTFMGEPRPAAGDCAAACDILFCCAMGDRCVGLEAADKDAFVEGCLDTCAASMALVAVVNGDNCDSTISAIKGASTDFEAACDGTGTGGAGGGTGGAGGN